MNTITREEILAKKDQIMLIDVREPQEIQTYGKILDAVNIPLSEIEEAFRMNEENFSKKYGFRRDTLIVFYCRSGGRSTMATQLVDSLGFQCANYEGSILDWSQFDESVQAY